MVVVAAIRLTSVTPRALEDACAMFSKKQDWSQNTRAAYQRWGIPVHLQLAIIYQESKFSADARPPRTRVFGLIPWGQASSSYGYAQATAETWQWYRKKTGHHAAARDEFSDAVDFIGWYCTTSNELLGIPKGDAYRQYLAYHEGHSGFLRGTHRKKRWLLRVAREVERRANRYRSQLAHCGH